MASLRRVAGIALGCALAGAAWAELPPLPNPGESGSHERYLEALRREEARIAAELLGRYERRLEEAPDDRVAAIERCRFLGAAFYDPDTEENPREEERAACVEQVEARFAKDPDARVFAVEQRWGAEAVEAGTRFLADPPASTEPHHRAAVHAHLARLLEIEGAGDALGHAERAIALDPSRDLRLLVARLRLKAGDRAGARVVLADRLEQTREDWELEAKAKLLADLEAFDASIAAFKEIERRRGATPRRLDYARALAGAGRIEDARIIYAEDPEGWASDEALRARFEFELEHGSTESARAAYAALRERGWEMDPVGRARLALLFAHPRAAWRPEDLTGLVALAAVGLALVLLPGLFIAPIHALGLLRERLGAAMPRASGVIALRDAWIASALVAVAHGLAFLAYPRALGAAADSASALAELARFALLGALVSVAGLLLLLRARISGLLARGRWGWMRTVSSALAVVVGLRLLVLAIARTSGSSPTDPATVELVESVQRSFGLTGSLVCAALLIPFVEEVVFRGVLLPAFATRLPAGAANAAQAALFGLAHAHPILTPAFFGFGLATGWMTFRSGSLHPALLAHGLNNALVCVALAWTGP